jgi:predicted permease
VVQKFVISAAVIVVSTVAGYWCRRRGWLAETASERIMTWVAVFGYSSVGFLTVWGTALKTADVILPLWAVLHMLVMTFLSLGVARWFARDRAERGLFALIAGIGNNGFTGGAFVLYLLYGEEAMGLSNIYILLFMAMAVLVLYPLARHFAEAQPTDSLAALYRKSLLDWRSLGLPVVLAALGLSAGGVQRPEAIVHYHLVDVLVYTITPLAFFGIGLRLRLSRLGPLKRMIAGTALVRFGLGALTAVGLAWATRALPWPLEGLRWKVYVVQGFVPTAITSVAVANMFRLKPEEASALFVANTVIYLVLVLPVVFWIFG